MEPLFSHGAWPIGLLQVTNLAIRAEIAMRACPRDPVLHFPHQLWRARSIYTHHIPVNKEGMLARQACAGRAGQSFNGHRPTSNRLGYVSVWDFVT